MASKPSKQNNGPETRKWVDYKDEREQNGQGEKEKKQQQVWRINEKLGGNAQEINKQQQWAKDCEDLLIGCAAARSFQQIEGKENN